MYYLGSHLGVPEDGYIGSGVYFRNAYLKRPASFKRRILESCIPSKDLLDREQAWLSLINVDELGKKYYNLKKVAAGGDIVSHLSADKKEAHREKSIKNLNIRMLGHQKYMVTLTKEQKNARAKVARNSWTSESRKNRDNKMKHLRKSVVLVSPTGIKCRFESVKQAAEEIGLTKGYRNILAVVRGNTASKSYKGWTGYYE